uniref:Uncharacterized protein n=1 Tax=Manihot esculenta TaxID=3983 RepID=A0A2C9WAQ4_MANES
MQRQSPITKLFPPTGYLGTDRPSSEEKNGGIRKPMSKMRLNLE